MTDIKTACIVIAYALPDDLLALFEAGDAPNITWHLFLHRYEPAIVDACETIAVRGYPRVIYIPHGTNRGLSASWNDGIENAYRLGADVAIIINDDMLPDSGDIQRVAQAAIDHPECGIIKCMGTDKRSGSRTPMEFGLTAITKRGWEVVGCFDENISPIYWEDIDWGRRHGLTGLPLYAVEDTSAVHQGSKTSLTVSDGVALAQQAYDRNQDYYIRKWGGTHHSGERFERPFDNPAFGLKIEYEDRHDPYPGYGVK